MPQSEADTCRRLITPKIYEAGWVDDQIFEQKTFTDGRIIVIGDKVKRGRQKRADYILCYRRNFPLAIIEAKSISKSASDGLQHLKNRVDLESLALVTDGIYEPEQFPGMILRHDEPKVTYLIFNSGKIVISVLVSVHDIVSL